MKNMNNSIFGYSGLILRVNLTTGHIYTEPTEQYADKWIGGRAINTWILLSELDPQISWNDPENILALGVGVLVGTLAPGACRVSIDTKNAFNNATVTVVLPLLLDGAVIIILGILAFIGHSLYFRLCLFI